MRNCGRGKEKSAESGYFEVNVGNVVRTEHNTMRSGRKTDGGMHHMHGAVHPRVAVLHPSGSSIVVSVVVHYILYVLIYAKINASSL